MEIIRKARTLISGAIAFVSCPCHLPVSLPLLVAATAGTSAGVWIANNTFTLGAIATAVFFGSLWLTFYWAKQPAVCAVPKRKNKQKRMNDNIIRT
jgi:cytochrome c biogenesis protein CcdA